MYAKKIKLFTILTFIVVLLTACSKSNTEDGYVLPDLSNTTIDNYKQHINTLKITFVERMENHDTIEENTFTRYGAGLTSGDNVDFGTIVYIYFSKGPEEVKAPDTEKPEILGIEDITIEYASDFDPYQGVSVTDNVDNDLIDRLIVTGTVNTWDLKYGDQIITYTVQDRAGNITEVNRTITIIPNDIDTRYTDTLTLDEDYTGKSFVSDGLEVVTLHSCIDGDTARFNGSEGIMYTRFLGIDTPETKTTLDPWGVPASNYTCNVLQNANIIVLEREGNAYDNYGRFLAWIWVDGRLLNLEIVEQAYSKSSGSSTSKYYDIFVEAERKTQGTKKRIWGELDPTYDYS